MREVHPVAAIRQISFDDFWQEVTAEAEKQRVG